MCSPPGRCVRMAWIRTIRCRRRRLAWTFAKSMGIEGTDQAALASLRALSAAGSPRCSGPAGTNSPQIELTPNSRRPSDHETAESAYKATRQPRVRWLSETTARISQATGSKLHQRRVLARFGRWSAQAKRPMIPTHRPSSRPWCRGPIDDSAKPNQRASPRTRSRERLAHVCTGSPTSRVRCGNGRKPAPRTEARSLLSSAHSERGRGRRRRPRPRTWRFRGWRRAIGSTSPRPATPTVLVSLPGHGTTPEGPDFRFPARRLCGRRSRSPQGAARC